MATSRLSNYAPINTSNNGQNIGYTTSTYIAKHQNFANTSIAGVKRSFNDFKASDIRLANAESRPTKQPTTTASSAPSNRLQASKINKVLADGTCKDEKSHERRISSTPGVTQVPELSLAHSAYDLPASLVQNFRDLGVHAIYPWQSKCLLDSGVLKNHRNLVYTAPTGGGKSLVADIVLLKRIIEEPRRKALMVLPYVALVQEKTKWLRRLTQGIAKTESTQSSQSYWPITAQDIRVAAFFGGNKSKLMWNDWDIAVCTIEKANLIINTALEESNVNDLAIAVLDELHMIDDAHRGYIMELMMTKLMLAQTKLQIIGMSATLPNPELLAKWLQAKFFVASYRPIPIEENLVYENAIYPTLNAKDFFLKASQLSSLDVTHKVPDPKYLIETSSQKEFSNPVTNAVVALAVDIAVSGYGSLVFCSSRQGTQNLAVLISESMPSSFTTSESLNKRMEVLATLQALPGGFDSNFSKTVPSGVAFHHAGLTTEERDAVAEAYEEGILKIMVATCSLAAGVNLPARRVILHGARMGRDLIGPAMLRQMRGRAGRKGKDEIGETYLCCQKSDLEAVAELFEAEVPPVVSSLTPEKRGIQRAVLEVITTRLANTYDGLRDYVTRSLLWQTTNHDDVLVMLDSALKDLLDKKLVEHIAHEVYVPTPLGGAIVVAGLTPEDGLFVHSDLRRALSSFVMDSEMQIFYLFTPVSPLGSDISFPIFRDLIDSLDEPSLNALLNIGISPGFVNRLANSGVESLPEKTAEEIKTARIYRRAYSTFALRDLCNEVSIHQISMKYSLPRGTIQTLAQTCHGFAAGMIKFCQRMAQSPSPTPYNNAFLPSTYARAPPISSTPDPQASGFSMLAAVLEHMQSRLYAGARADLLEMTQVSFVKGRMARMLYECGFKSVRALADADPRKDILPVMWSAFGWKLNQKSHDIAQEENGTEDATRKSAKELYEMRKQMLENRLLQKAEVMVASASKIHERDVLKIAADLEE